MSINKLSMQIEIINKRITSDRFNQVEYIR